MNNKQSIKIAVLTDQLVLGGVQKDAAFEAFHLNKLGHKARLEVLMRRGSPKKFKKYFPNIPIKFLSDKYPRVLRDSIKFPVFSFFSSLHILSPFLAPRIIKPKNYDMVIAHGTTTCLTALSLWKIHQIPYIAVIQDPMEYILKKVYSQTVLKYFFWLISPILFYLEKQIVQNAKTVVVISDKHLPFIQKSYGITPEVLTPATSILSKLPQKKDNYLIASSRWESAKNPQLLLDLMRNLPQNKLLMVGSWTNTSDFSSFKQKIKDQNLKKRIVLKTNVLPKHLQDLYANALVWIHPNVEAFGMGGFEAASCGCPVVIPDGSGLTQILKDGQDGFFPKIVGIEAFIKPVRYLIDHPEIAYSMGKHAWQTIRQSHSWQQHARQLEGLVLSTLGKIDMVVLELGHARGTVIAGGDKLLEEMSGYLSKNISLTVLLPEIASWHWRNKGAKLLTIKKWFLDNNSRPLAIFITYIYRIFISLILLRKTPSKYILYSSTNIFPDVIPAFIIKLFNPKIKWFARIHHLAPSPFKRPGNPIVNSISYILQEISLWALKSKADLVAALNYNLIDDLSRKGFATSRLVVVTAGIDSRKWQSGSSHIAKKYSAVFLGRMHPAKGIFDLIPIWARVCQDLSNAKLVIIGQTDPSILSIIIAQSKNNAINDMITITGPLTEEQVQQYLKQSKIFLFTDHEAGFGLAGLEAMTMGLPIIGWDIGILGTVFKKGFVRVSPFNIDQYANAIITLLTNPKNLKKLSQMARDEARIHDWQKVTKRFETLLLQLKTQKI